MTRLSSWVCLLTGVGFALGSTVHAVCGVLLCWGFEVYGPGYPGSRHVAFALIDATIAGIAWQKPRWLVFPLLSFAIAQAIEHGVTRVVVLVTVAAGFAAYDRWR